jgi:hypothetical protein
MRIKNKKNYKFSNNYCCLCGENDANVLDVHRIHEGSRGGEYYTENCCVTCANCHRKVHAGSIKIIRKHPTLSHRYYIEVLENDQIKFIEVPM